MGGALREGLETWPGVTRGSRDVGSGEWALGAWLGWGGAQRDAGGVAWVRRWERDREAGGGSQAGTESPSHRPETLPRSSAGSGSTRPGTWWEPSSPQAPSCVGKVWPSTKLARRRREAAMRAPNSRVGAQA